VKEFVEFNDPQMQCHVLIKLCSFSQFWRQSAGITCMMFQNAKIKHKNKLHHETRRIILSYKNYFLKMHDSGSHTEVKGHQVDAIPETCAFSKNNWHHCILLKIFVLVVNYYDSASDLGENIEVNA